MIFILLDISFSYSNLAACFTLFFSWWVGLESVNAWKLFAVFCCFFGASLLVVGDRSDGSGQTFSGDIVAMCSAAGYGIYTTTMKYLVSLR